MRLFVAVPVPREVLRELEKVQEELRGAGAPVRWVRTDGMHLTLRFLGEAEEERRAALVAALGEVHGASFDAEVRGIGFFPGARRPRVVWAGVEEGSGRLAALQKEIERRVVSLGFEPEERGEFHPHLTLGRLKETHRVERLAPAAERIGAREFGRFRAAAFHLYRSELGPEGARYTVLAAFPLEGGGA